MPGERISPRAFGLVEMTEVVESRCGYHTSSVIPSAAEGSVLRNAKHCIGRQADHFNTPLNKNLLQERTGRGAMGAPPGAEEAT